MRNEPDTLFFTVKNPILFRLPNGGHQPVQQVIDYVRHYFFCAFAREDIVGNLQEQLYFNVRRGGMGKLLLKAVVVLLLIEERHDRIEHWGIADEREEISLRGRVRG